jgi:hypothetical protein
MPWQAQVVTAADVAPTLTGALLPLGDGAERAVAARVDPTDCARSAALLTPTARAHMRSLPVGATLRAVAGAWEVFAASDQADKHPQKVAARLSWLMRWRDLHPTWPRADFEGLLARIPQEDDEARHQSLWALLTAQAGGEPEVITRCRALSPKVPQVPKAQGALWLVCAAVTRDLDALRQQAAVAADLSLGFSAQALRLWLEVTPPDAPLATLSALAVRCARAADDAHRAALLDESTSCPALAVLDTSAADGALSLPKESSP